MLVLTFMRQELAETKLLSNSKVVPCFFNPLTEGNSTCPEGVSSYSKCEFLNTLRIIILS